jgi:E-phenylitaconyl-CoA hydratase
MSIDQQLSDYVLQVTINRPDALNALDPETIADLRSTLVDARDNDDVRMIILTGAGDRAFCVGADLKRTLPSSSSFAEDFWLSEERAIESGSYIRGLDFLKLQLWKPLIAAINGHCIGGGLEIALQCDLRIASTNATFGLREAKVSSIPAIGGLHRLLRSIPSAVAMKMALTGDSISAEEAHRVGLVSDLHSPENLLQEAHDIASVIAGNGPLSVQAIKRLSVEGNGLSLDEVLLLDQMTWGILRDTHDRVEGREAFAEKREPRFEGR